MNKKVLKSLILEYNLDFRNDIDEKRNLLYVMILVL